MRHVVVLLPLPLGKVVMLEFPWTATVEKEEVGTPPATRGPLRCGAGWCLEDASVVASWLSTPNEKDAARVAAPTRCKGLKGEKCIGKAV